jgi:hypothetical protein
MPFTRAVPALAFAALAVAGCASTRVVRHGPLSAQEPLVTVVISEDRRVVEEECRLVPSLGPVMGCQSSRPVHLSDGRRARAVRIVRFTDRLPSEMAAEIEVHELCHAVAALQSIEDPCHADNHGFLQARRTR